MLTGRCRRHAGMTLVEILIALALLAIVAAVVYPTVAGQLRTGQATATGNQLVNLREAIGAYRENVGAYPLGLVQLTTTPVNGDDDSCGANLSATERAGWRGPYLNQVITGAMPAGEATIQATLVRVPATTAGTQVGDLQIIATGVANDVATDLEARFDGNADLSGGTVTWVSTAGGTLTFHIPIRGC